MTKSKEQADNISPWWDESWECLHSPHAHREPMLPDGAIGFVYVIKVGKMQYIGCKQLISNRTLPPLKGMKKKRKVQKPSDWVTYCGSSKKLLADIAAGAKVERTILYWAHSKSELAYVELKIQMALDVVRSPRFYNGIINVRLPVIKLKENYHSCYECAMGYYFH